MDDIDAIVAPRIDDPTVNVVKGARVRTCALCGYEVWVAPSTFATFKGLPMPPIWCPPCAFAMADAENAKKRRGGPGRA